MKGNKLVIFLMIMLALTGCSSATVDESLETNNNSSKTINEDKINVVCTIFPEQDWIREIVGDNIDKFEITTLMDTNIDLHNYQPSASDIVKLSNADMFVYVGGQSNLWVEEALLTANNSNMVVVNLIEVLGDMVKEEEYIEGMEHDHEEEGHEDRDHQEELDEHIWLSLKNAEYISTHLTREIINLDFDNLETYEKNLENYIEKLKILDEEYIEVIENSSKNTLVFGDRFPFRYLTDDYNLNYYAAFSGCSAEIEASFETIVFLANKVDEEKLNYICTIDGRSHKIAETIVENTNTKNQEILVLNSMQSISNNDIKNELSYIDIMKENLEVLKIALN